MDEAGVRAGLVRHWEYEGVDYDVSHEIYHEDAILEFPQSGERFIGKQTFLAWRKQYPARIEFRLRRISGSGDLWVTENLISYDGSPPMPTVNILRFRGDRIARETLYVVELFDAPEWRRPWSTPFDRLASVAPSDWQAGVPFGLDAKDPTR